MTIQIVYVSVPDFARHEEIADFVELHNGRIIEFYTMDLAKLEFIAKHRVLPVPTLLVMNNDKVVARIVKDIPKVKELTNIINLTQEHM